MRKKILLINRTAPHGTLRAQEALDVLLMASTFNQKFSVLFLDDGVLQLKNNQNPQPLGLKNFSAAFKAFSLYDIDNVYADEQSLKDRGLVPQALIVPPALLDTTGISTLLAQQDHILNF